MTFKDIKATKPIAMKEEETMMRLKIAEMVIAFANKTIQHPIGTSGYDLNDTNKLQELVAKYMDKYNFNG